MKILRTIGILVLVAGLVLGGTSSALAQGPGKRGLFGTVTSVTPINGGYVIELETEDGTFSITADDTATKYMVPRETKGPKGLDRFLEIVGDPPEIVGRRIAVLVTFTNESTADAIRLMLIPSPSSPPSHAHRVGVVDIFTEGTSITIIDEDDVTHTFALLNGTVYRPAKIDSSTEIVAGVHVTVVIKGDPKLPNPIAKAIVLHKPEE